MNLAPPASSTSVLNNRSQDLRVHDLIAKVAHVRLKDTLRVLLALRAVSKEYEFAVDHIVESRYDAEKPIPAEAIQCERAYGWMHRNPELNRLFYEIEQLQ